MPKWDPERPLSERQITKIGKVASCKVQATDAGAGKTAPADG
jgi:hypothetical protein